MQHRKGQAWAAFKQAHQTYAELGDQAGVKLCLSRLGEMDGRNDKADSSRDDT
ncbi:hypothetical protein FRB95_010810 [Tulasnella sp. JGI-2019a]|nr:hypothetical protein FRB95_010810 [Tulasnella sp. JGI-2019a]